MFVKYPQYIGIYISMRNHLHGKNNGYFNNMYNNFSHIY